MSSTNWISNTRAIATISVIILHVASSISYTYGAVPNHVWLTGNLYDSAVRFCVPIFFMISGALLLSKDYNVSEFLNKRVVRILPPFIFWSILYILYDVFVLHRLGDSLKGLGEYSLNALLHGSKYHLWFVYVILGLYLFVPLIRKWIRRANEMEIRIFLGVWAVSLFYFIPPISKLLPNLSFLKFTGYMGYMVLGFYLSQSNFIKKQTALLFVIIGFTITFMGTYLQTYKHNQFSSFFYEYISFNVVLSAVGVFVLCKHAVLLPKRIQTIFSFIDRYSFGIYLVHVLVLSVLEKWGFSELTFHPIISIPLLSLTCLVVSGGIIYIMKLHRYTAVVAG